jgi:hypothetical protein
MYLTRKQMSRRTMLRGVGATVALPVLDAMAPPALTAAAPKPPVRLVCVEMVHGSAGSSKIGAG